MASCTRWRGISTTRATGTGGRAAIFPAWKESSGRSRPPAGALHGNRPVDRRAPLREALVHAPHHGHVGVVEPLGHRTDLAVAQREAVDGEDGRDLVAAAAEE